MSNIVGHAERVQSEGKPDVFYGEIAVGGISGEVYLIPYADKRSDKSPDYEVKMRGFSGDWESYGNAWAKKMKVGGDMLSVTFDAPQLPQPVYVAMFPDDEQPKDTPKNKAASWSFTWSRPRRAGGPAMAQPAQAATSDAIPF